MRLFTAVNISDEVKDKIAEIQSVFKKTLTDIKWIDKEKFHITLKFLGEVNEQKVDFLIKSLEGIALNYKPFKVSFSGVGVFPNMYNPRVVWIGIKEGKQELINLYSQIEDKFYQLGFKKEKRNFSAHLTLGRVRSLQNIEVLAKKIKHFEGVETFCFEVKSIDLIQSLLEPYGAQYKCLKSIFI